MSWAGSSQPVPPPPNDFWKPFSHSTVVQRRILLLGSTAASFIPDGQTIPLVLVPYPAKCCYFFLTVPTGYFVMHQSFQKHESFLKPGLKFCWPAFNKISHVVTMAAITYDAPSQQVPTADNIMVDVNLSITFRLTDEDSAYKFVYLIGVSRFNSYLSTKVEEAIRGLVRGVTHNKVNDLREEFAIGMISNLNNKLNGFGIRVMSVKITDVRLPQMLQDRLEKTTSFKTRIEEEEKAQENRKRSLTDEAEKKLTAIVQTNHRKIQELTAECVKFEIQMTEMQAASRGGSQVFEVQARSNMDVALTKARGALTAGKSKGQREAEDMVRQAAILSDQRKTKVNQDCQTIVLGSEGRLASARAAAQSMIASAEAEFAGAQKLKEKRRIELEWQRLDALQVLASKGKRLLTGDIGCRILNEMAAVQVGDNMHK